MEDVTVAGGQDTSRAIVNSPTLRIEPAIAVERLGDFHHIAESRGMLLKMKTIMKLSRELV